jgi:hypothetical protein
MEQHIDTNSIKEAVGVIKTAILQGQYLAAKDVTRVQLATYFSIGKYLSLKTRIATWGSGALESISKQLRKELPGLRGFSATNLKNMRLFYENWRILDGKSSVATDDFSDSNSADAKQALLTGCVKIGAASFCVICCKTYIKASTFSSRGFVLS